SNTVMVPPRASAPLSCVTLTVYVNVAVPLESTTLVMSTDFEMPHVKVSLALASFVTVGAAASCSWDSLTLKASYLQALGTTGCRPEVGSWQTARMYTPPGFGVSRYGMSWIAVWELGSRPVPWAHDAETMVG